MKKQTIKKEHNFKKVLVVELINLIWFGAWLYIIFGLHQSGWWILVPMSIHWTYESVWKL
jgi:hypothetical protein